jgi:hypothetical protein
VFIYIPASLRQQVRRASDGFAPPVPRRGRPRGSRLAALLPRGERMDTAHFDAGPAGDVIAAGDKAGRIHLICAQTGAKCLCLKGHR